MSNEDLKAALAAIKQTVEVAQGLIEASSGLAESIRLTQSNEGRFVERQELIDLTGYSVDNIKANMPYWTEGKHYTNTSNTARPAYRYNVAAIRKWFATPAAERNTVK